MKAISMQAKRCAQPPAVQPETKRAKLSPLVAGVAEAMGKAKNLSKSCHEMLIAGLPGALETPASERHDHQATIISWVGEVLSEVHEEFKSNLASAEEALVAADRTKGELEDNLSEARAVLAQRHEAVKAQQGKLASCSEAVQAAKACLCEAQRAEAEFNDSLAETREEMDTLDGALQGSIRSLVEAEIFRAEEVAGHLSVLTPLARRLALDDSLLMALPSACICSPDRRSSFDSMVIDQLQAGLSKRVTELTEILDRAKATVDGHAAAVASAQQGVHGASNELQSIAAQLVEAQSEHFQASEAVAAAEAAGHAHASELSVATEARDKGAVELQNFEGYNMECFNTLRNKVAQAAHGGA